MSAGNSITLKHLPCIIRLVCFEMKTSFSSFLQNHGLAPLHIAVALPCVEGIEITRLLLEAKADPDLEDLAYGNSANGRTALHIACTREDCDKVCLFSVIRRLATMKNRFAFHHRS